MYTSEVKADAQRKIETERQAVVERAEKTIEHNKQTVVTEA